MRRSGFWFVNGVFESSPCQEAMHDSLLKKGRLPDLKSAQILGHDEAGLRQRRNSS